MQISFCWQQHRHAVWTPLVCRGHSSCWPSFFWSLWPFPAAAEAFNRLRNVPTAAATYDGRLTIFGAQHESYICTCVCSWCHMSEMDPGAAGRGGGGRVTFAVSCNGSLLCAISSCWFRLSRPSSVWRRGCSHMFLRKETLQTFCTGFLSVQEQRKHESKSTSRSQSKELIMRDGTLSCYWIIIIVAFLCSSL